MTDQSHRAWQRTTALAKIARDREAFQRSGTHMSEVQLAAAAGAYVGAQTTDVLGWMRGQA